MGYYDITNLDNEAEEFGAKIRIIYGQRSNGKTYQLAKKVVNNYNNNNERALYVRRWRDDLRPSLIGDTFNDHSDKSRYYQRQFMVDHEIFCRTIALTEAEHFKGAKIPQNTTIIWFDEFVPTNRELPDEFTLWQSVLSTAIRDRDNALVYLCGNNYGVVSTYFTHYGIRMRDMKKGSINLITVKQSDDREIKIAVEWTEKNDYVTRSSSHYFVTTNPHNNLLNGDFEIKRYPTALKGVTIRNWNNAKLFPVSFRHDGRDYQIRIYNGVVLIKEWAPAMYIYDPATTFDTWKVITKFPNSMILPLDMNIQHKLVELIQSGIFIPESDIVGEIARTLFK